MGTKGHNCGGAIMFSSVYSIATRVILACCVIVMAATEGLAQSAVKSIDRSGTEVFSIIQSEIKSIKYEDDLLSYVISRRHKGSNRFEIVSTRKSDGKQVKHRVSSKRVLVMFNGFSDIRALQKFNASEAVKKLCTIEFDGFSKDLEPQSYDFYLAGDERVVLRLGEKESYVVELPLTLFRKAQFLLTQGH